MTRIEWPDNKSFAFTIFDDTDLATLENIRPVYDLLDETGFRTTKSVWPLKGTSEPSAGGVTCEDETYFRWLYSIRKEGFEIGYHMATYHSSVREETIRGLDTFERLFGGPPLVMSNHSGCVENLYWGSRRLSGLNRLFYNLATRFRYNKRFQGHLENNPYFWGDLCRERIRYVRSFVFNDINSLAVCPFMPYHDPDRPFVNYWYASSEGPEINSFVNCLSEENQDQLEEEGGACIMYTHLACGFVDGDRLNQRFESLIRRLGRKNGWFVPVGQLLDFLRKRNGGHVINSRERNRLERTWLRHKFRVGSS